MLLLSRILLVLAGILLIVDAVLLFFNIPNPLGYQLPCPITLVLLGLGVLIFGIWSGASFKKT